VRIADRYELREHLGRGGLADAHAAHDVLLDAAVVLKILRAGRDPELLMREHALLRACAHPSLVRVRDFGWASIEGERRPYYVADRVHGPTLDAWAEGRRWEDVRGALIDVTRALGALHRAGLRHGDVKPDNVRVRENDGRAVLLDLSCAAILGAPLTTLSGTPGYLAPELERGDTPDARADLYALGVLWERLPVRGPATLARFRASLRAPDRNDRPADTDAVLEALGAAIEPAPMPVGGAPLVGRALHLRAFAEHLAALREGRPGPRVFALEGPRGMGHTRLLRELLWRAQHAVRTVEGLVARRADPVRELFERALGRSIAPGLASIARAIDELARGEPSMLVLDDAHRLAPRDRATLERALALVPNDGALAVLTTIGAREGTRVPLEGLDVDAIAQWIEAVGARHVDARRLAAITEGRPTELADRLERALRGEDWRRPRKADEVPRALRAVVALASWLDAGVSTRETVSMGIRSTTIARALEQGWLREEAGALRAVVTVEGDDLAPLARRAIECGLVHGPARASLLARAGARAEASALAEREWMRDPRGWLPALEALAEHGDAADRVRLARAALRAGDASRAGRALAAIERKLPASLALERELAQAEHALKTGRADEARSTLERASSRVHDDPRIADLLARVHLAQARYDEAEHVARDGARRARDPELAARLAETEGLALGYRGHEGADAILARAGDAHRAIGNVAGEHRVATCRGILAQRRGALREAIAAYREALALAERHGLDDSLSVSWLNLGTALTDDGDWGSALDAYAQGLRYAAVLDQPGTEASLRFNLGNLYVEIGAFDRAATLHAQVEERARALGFDHLAAPMARLKGEIAWRMGDGATADRALAEAAALYARADAPLDRREVALLEAERAIDAVAYELAERHLGAPSSEHASLDRLVRARLALARGRELDAVRYAEESIASGSDRRIVARAHALLSEAFARRGASALSEQHAESARALWQRIEATLPAALRAAFASHPHRAIVSRPTHDAPSARLGSASLRRFLAINRRLSSSLDAREVLEHAVDAAIELTEAERGFVLLRGEGGAIDVAAARNLDREHVPSSHLKFSRSIAERVLATDEPVVTLDARADPRFASERSVHAMRLSSVACVPIRSAEGARGALYLDNRFEHGRFTDEDLELLHAFADQVAIALRNAELHAALAERTRALDEARAALEARVEGQAARIADLSSEVEKRRRALEYRYDYGRIVGRGAAMRRVLDTLERVIGTDLSVLVQGESGTGKELVAKAIHVNGARRDGPLVSLNCAALPEALIESELFGHERGAFTGADRRAPGLLVEASGGTVFLDELGEMPLGMQAKLLRALEEREVRPVGGTRALPIDVRLVAATNRDLRAEVKAGRFREDLYFRIGVVTILLPPLRERMEDLAELCASILREHGDKRLTKDAFEALRAHAWPGNVRELRNVLARASALSTGDRIDREDLALDVVPALPSDRASYEASEAERIQRALVTTGWNVSRVSRELGIPRQTLYRKMREHGLHRKNHV
jgi:transcriptional regulator with GAF, ATPase, and Fis domain